MLSVTLRIFIFTATLSSLVVCDIQGLYKPQSGHHQQNTEYYDSLHSNALSIAEPRFSLESIGQLLPLINFDLLIEPIVKGVAFIAGLLGVYRLTDYLLEMCGLATTSEKNINKTEKVEQSNDIEDARRKRMISAQETERVLRSIEMGEKAFGDQPKPSEP